jgi:hypothetical protein
MSPDEATVAAAQDILAALDSDIPGPVGHGQICLGGEVVAPLRASATTQPASAPAPPEPAPAATGPVGPEPMRFGGPVVASAPDDALEGARAEILAALWGAPTPGAW